MRKVTPIDRRKTDHIRINLDQDVRSTLTNGLERYRFIHQALPELNLNQIDLTLRLFKKDLNAPILISSMTGEDFHPLLASLQKSPEHFVPGGV